ncbi:MAG: hypothetical protein Kow00121_32320 [Elainellaceae cyanobacterium]
MALEELTRTVEFTLKGKFEKENECRMIARIIPKAIKVRLNDQCFFTINGLQ